jgi:hypothetical protein
MKQSVHTQGKKHGIVRRWATDVVRQQVDQAWGQPQRTFWGETMAGVRRAFGVRVNPQRRVETFDAAVRRLGLTQAQLDEQLSKYKTVHLVLYGVAGALLVYGMHLTLAHGLLVGAGAYVAGLSAAVYGYLHGFRAWQIEHRSLIRLQDALRIPGTYLVL